MRHKITLVTMTGMILAILFKLSRPPAPLAETPPVLFLRINGETLPPAKGYIWLAPSARVESKADPRLDELQTVWTWLKDFDEIAGATDLAIGRDRIIVVVPVIDKAEYRGFLDFLGHLDIPRLPGDFHRSLRGDDLVCYDGRQNFLHTHELQRVPPSLRRLYLVHLEHEAEHSDIWSTVRGGALYTRTLLQNIADSVWRTDSSKGL